MNRDEIKKALEAKGVDFDGRWTTDKLFELLQQSEPETSDSVSAEPEMGGKPQYTDEQIEDIGRAVSGVDEPTYEEMAEQVGLHKQLGGDTVTKNGIILPAQSMVHLLKSKYNYFAKDGLDEVAVYRVNQKGREEYIRTYSQSRHGENYAGLAKRFIEKNNR